MTISEVTKSVVVLTGQSFSTETFELSTIVNEVRKLTGLPDFQIKDIAPRVIQDFTKQTWILEKVVEVGDVIAADESYSEILTEAHYEEILTEEDYDAILGSEVSDIEEADSYSVTIDLETYSDGLLPYKVNKIYLNETETKVEPLSYIGYPSSLPDGVYYEISGYSIKIFPVDLTDKIQIPLVFKTDTDATDIPVTLEDYEDQLVAGTISKLRRLPQYKDNEEFLFNKSLFDAGVSKAKNEWFKRNSGTRMSGTGFI